MITWSLIDRKDLGQLKIAIDWENDRKIYIDLLDIVFMSQILSEDLMEECVTKLINPETNDIYLDINEVVNSFRKHDSIKAQQIIQWLETDILPSVKVMPKYTPLKL